MIYLDNHATTPCDPRVVDAMIPLLTDNFGNPHSGSHAVGRRAADVVEASLADIGSRLNVAPEQVLMTSGATESNNLAIEGICRHPRQKRRHIVTSTIEHHAVLDVAARLEKDGFRVTQIPVHPQGSERAGQVDLDRLADAVDEDTALVSIHWANNEIGVIQPIREISTIAHAKGALLHCDAAQAVGRIPIDLVADDVDLLSAAAHKFYGPKGAGILTIGGGKEQRRIRLRPMIVGGGQQGSLRSGTMAPANVRGCATALALAVDEIPETSVAVKQLRQTLWQRLQRHIGELKVNGPELDSPDRLPGNLNVVLPSIEGAAWMSATPEIAFSSGSACSSAEAAPSHVLTGIGLDESSARRSVRFGVGKFTTAEEIDAAAEQLVQAYDTLLPSLS